MIVTADFVGAYARTCTTVLCEAEALTRLCENVTGTANKRSAARWLSACVGSLRFESELRQSAATAAHGWRPVRSRRIGSRPVRRDHR